MASGFITPYVYLCFKNKCVNCADCIGVICIKIQPLTFNVFIVIMLRCVPPQLMTEVDVNISPDQFEF